MDRYMREIAEFVGSIQLVEGLIVTFCGFMIAAAARWLYRHWQRWRHLRSGTRTLVFVSTGGTCRDPMAAVIARELLKGRNPPVKVYAAGIAKGHSRRASKAARFVVREALGTDLLRTHRTRVLDGSLVARSDLILAMQPSYVKEIVKLFPSAKTKTYTIHGFLGLSGSIENPYRGPDEMDEKTLVRYRAAFTCIREVLTKHIDRIYAALTLSSASVDDASPGLRIGIATSIAAIIGSAIAIAMTTRLDERVLDREPAPDPRYACIPLESASDTERVAHSTPEIGLIFQPDPHWKSRARAFPIPDPENGPLQSTWTTSQYSYEDTVNGVGPGGGRSDSILRVGGFGDTYLSLLHVPVPVNELVQRAVIRLAVAPSPEGSQPTAMTLRAINDEWRVTRGRDNRIWWRDCPQSRAIRNHLPAPDSRSSIYEIDITELYNLWVSRQQDPNGIVLEPEQIGSWLPGRPRYGNFNFFHSTRAANDANRPRLILTY